MKAGNRQEVKVRPPEGLATQGETSQAFVRRKDTGEALGSKHMGRVLSHEMLTNLEADLVPVGGRQYQGVRFASTSWLQRGQRPCARMEVYYTETERSLCRPEVSHLKARTEKVKHRTWSCTTLGSRT